MTIIEDFDFGCDPNVSPPPVKPRFTWLFEHDLMDMPPPVFIVDKWMVEHVTTLLYGAQRSLKSFFALDVGLCITHGETFHGCKVQHGAVAYICGEGLPGIGKRIAAWRQNHHIGKAKRSPLVTLNRAVHILNPEEMGALIHELHGMEIEHGFKFQLIIIDTLSKSLHGAKEDDEGIGAALSQADLMREALNANVLLVHHAGKNAAAGARGSSLLGCNCDAVYCVTREDNNPEITVTAEKLKDTEDGWAVVFDARVVELENKPGQTSLVLDWRKEWTGEEIASREQSAKMEEKAAKAEKKMLEMRFEIASHLNPEESPYSMSQVCEHMNKGRGAYYAVIRNTIPTEKVLVKHRKGNMLIWRDEKRDLIYIELA